MTATSPVADPLTVLPPEIVLRILEFTPISALASLTAVSQAWHRFIDVTHQEAIYSSESKTAQPRGARDFSFLSDTTSFSNLFKDTASWKDLCKRQTLLARNWAKSNPASRESVLQVGNEPVWRFRADFKRRFFVSTSHAGGLNVTDMDTGRLLWRLPSTLDRDEDAVRPFAHLEYQDGMAVFDREGDAVEVWQADLEGAAHGEFRRIAVLNHDCQTRGFQLSHWTLCVVSTEGQGFVYDMKQRPPKLTTHLEIEHDAVGHLDQSKDVVIYSMGPRGYHAYDKTSGAFLGALQPMHCTEKYHIRPPAAAAPPTPPSLAGAARLLPPRPPRKDSLEPIELAKGILPLPADRGHIRYREDEWGAGMLHGDLFVGVSRAGRVFVCSDWRKAVHDRFSLAAHSSLIECESDGRGFDLGGWLSVRNHRLMCEIQDRIYVVALDENNKIQDVDHPTRASYSLVTSSAPQLAVPVSFMALYDDAIITTYTTLGWRQTIPDIPGDIPQQQREGAARIFPTKAIRIVNLAPDLSNKSSSNSKADKPQESTATGEGLWDPDQRYQPPDAIWHSQAGLLHLVSMLGEGFIGEVDEGEEEDEEEDDEEATNAIAYDELMNAITRAHDGSADGEWEDMDDDDDEGGHNHGHGLARAHEGA
ncbi:tRNA pseudouridine synthase 1 [Aspergillus hancockii]|nr:tRNA pseudouridine synthase 1 [Aspergillus hancockii]